MQIWSFQQCGSASPQCLSTGDDIDRSALQYFSLWRFTWNFTHTNIDYSVFVSHFFYLVHPSEHCVLARAVLQIRSWNPAARTCHRSAHPHSAPHCKVATSWFQSWIFLHNTLFVSQFGRPCQAFEQKSWRFEKSHLFGQGDNHKISVVQRILSCNFRHLVLSRNYFLLL